MNKMHDYHSRLSDPASRRFGTFSYLPPMPAQAVRTQVEFLIARGWAPSIEHTEPQHASGSYWYMWKLPMFGETSADKVLAEVQACHKANPGNHIRLVGYDKLRQTQGTALVVVRAQAT